ncbi:MAG TPA: hypothetical protein VEZ59_06460, partial [Sphingopyxis sp.]|nr:hypothetical protein [Sphingopyxis sp.]
GLDPAGQAPRGLSKFSKGQPCARRDWDLAPCWMRPARRVAIASGSDRLFRQIKAPDEGWHGRII